MLSETEQLGAQFEKVALTSLPDLPDINGQWREDLGFILTALLVMTGRIWDGASGDFQAVSARGG